MINIMTIQNSEIIDNENMMQKTWRPALGYSLAVSLPLFLFTMAITIIYSMFKGIDFMVHLSNMYLNLSGILMAIFGGWFGVVGVFGHGRSKEKQESIKFNNTKESIIKK
jgi:hypothetical protein